jgi:murein DD-endopeptidase MepM/ murein hydrolase activator NlpD
MINPSHSKNAQPNVRFHRTGTFAQTVRRVLCAAVFALAGVQAAPALASEPTAVGGPYEAARGNDGSLAKADQNYRALFLSWKRLDQFQQGAMAIPSQRPIQQTNLTSGFGVRSDPFRGGAAMHAGVDMAGPIGTPIYATADGWVGRAGWANGYGNLVELEHGRGVETRYGHLSAILVKPGQRIRRGDLIARMGSTGRSTGSHLHYEVRIDGRAVNPIPFLQTSDYIVEVARRSDGTQIAMGGPDN